MRMDSAILVVFGHFITVLILSFGLECVTSSRDLALHKNATQSSTYSIYGAGRAVDGVPGRDVDGGHCSHTGMGQSQVWWKVDLGQVYRIQTINITYRHDFTYRLSGYYLYVTNDTHMTQRNGGIDEDIGHLCFNDHGPRYPSYNQSRTCPVIGRYVIIYNQRPAEFIPSDHSGYYSRTEVLLELCEVQVFGCPVGQFGDGCIFTCHCAEGGCDPDTGQCDVTGCQTGWKGPSCYIPLSDVAYGRTAIQSSVNINKTVDANKAVDGYPGKDSCSHTYPHLWREAWWMVDLGHEHTINTINIVFTHQHQLTISGYFLYVSSEQMSLYHTTALQEAHLCYHDTTTASDGPPPYRQSHQCSVTGRYVIVYNNRSLPLVNSLSLYSPEDAVVELCDVQVFSCLTTTFGPNCSQVCHCMSDGCDPVSGACHNPGCMQGWTGDSCSTHECQTGHFGPDCTTECHCQTGGCNVVNGTCNARGCQDGWEGDACNQECVNPTFGRDCNQTCHCARSGCDRVNGTCNIPGCTEGWTTPTCSQECGSHTFGPDCNQNCHCARSGCDRINGTCFISGCTEGWIGDTCSQECYSGYFGLKCSKVCHCQHDGCDHVSGTCDLNGCQAGWSGQACDQQCVGQTFGRDCNLTCYCARAGCNRTNGVCNLPGCSEGWMGNTCSQECGNNTFGRDCNHTCHCASSDCDRVNGTCAIPGCTKGWTGHSCSHECSLGYFGSNCSEVCHCQHQGCNQVDGMCDHVGCQAGWSGQACDQPQKHVSSKSDCPHVAELSSSADSSCSTGYALLGTFLAISVILNIGFIIYSLRVRFRNSRTETPPKELQTYHIPNYENNYEGLDSSKIDTTRNIYDTIIK